MLAVKALLVDFDGTACLQDVSELLLDAFGEPGWERFDDAVDTGEMGLREAADHQVAMLRGSLEEMLAFALERAELAPTFAPFVGWAKERDLPLVLASDGFAFYIRPILERAGLGHLEVVTNELVEADGRWTLRHPNGHPECIGCGTCKMLAAQRLRERQGRSRSSARASRTGTARCTRTSCSRRTRSSRSASRTACRTERGRRSTTCGRRSRRRTRSPAPSRPERCPGWRTA